MESKWQGGLGSGGGAGSPYWGDPVPNFGSLPGTGLNGEIRIVTSPTYAEYIWNGSAWVLFYQPLPVFVSFGVLFGDGTNVPVQDPDLTFDPTLPTPTLAIGASSPAQDGRIIIGGSGTGVGYVDGGGGALNVVGGPLQLGTYTTAETVDIKPGGVQLVKFDAAAMRVTLAGLLNLSIFTASRAVYLDANKDLAVSPTTDAQLAYLVDTIGPVQAGIDSKLPLAGGTLTGPLNLAADPTGALEAATKQYVDAVAQGLDAKQSAIAASTANIPALSGLLTIDGVTLQNLDRVLVKNQSTPSQNGIYVASAGAWSRATDFDAWAEIPGGFVFVEQGTINGSTGWACIAATSGTVGTTPIPFTQFSGAGTYTADGNGLELVGTQFSLELDGTTLSKSPTGIKVAAGGITDVEVALTAGLQFTKMETLTASKALVTDPSGKVTPSATSATEIGYVAGVTGPLQTQIDNISSINAIVAVSSNVTLTNRALHLVDTSAARTLILPDPAVVGTKGFLIVKDKTKTSDVNPITIARSSAPVKIEGVAADWIIQETASSLTFVSDGVDWFII